MKTVKKLLKIIGILVFLLILSLVTIPILFKDQIVEKVKEIANASVNAKVDFGDFDLSLIASFPSFTFEINDVSVINKAPFDGDTLAHIGNINLELDLGSVINGRYVVSSFNINDLTANAKVLKDGKANWDIAIEDSIVVEEDTEGVDEEVTEEGDLITGLESFSINNVNLSYVDLQSEMVAIVKGFNQSGSLIMVNDSTDININSTINSILFDLEGERLANNLKFESNLMMKADLATMAFQFKETLIKLNELKIGVDGTMGMPDDMYFDLAITAKDNKFKDILSLIPAAYLSDLEGVETKGTFNLGAHLKGKMTDEDLPGFDVNFEINDAYLKYPDLPEAVDNIQMDLAINNKDGIIDHTEVDLKLFHLELAKNPIDIKYFLTNVESDPTMKVSIKSKFRLENLAKAIPMEEGEELKGGLNVNLDFAGKLSSIENEKYEEFKAGGQVIFDNLLYNTPDLPATLIKTGYLNFSSHYLEVSNFDMRLGKSDLTANGRIDNILTYVFKDSLIVGRFNLKSDYFDLNELMEEDTVEVLVVGEIDEASMAMIRAQAISDSIESEEPLEVFEIPKNVNFVLASNFKKIDFEDMPIDDFKGQIVLEGGIAHFNEASMRIFDGVLKMDGDYNTVNMAHPSTSLDFSIDDMEIRNAYKAFNPIKEMVPIAEKANGKFHTDFKFTSNLSDSLTPIYSTMNGKGYLSTTNLGFSETDGWKNLMDALKIRKEKFDKIKAEDIKVTYEFKDGKLYTEPFKLNLGNIKGVVSGWTSFDNALEYKYALKIPRDELGVGANGLVSFAEGLAGKNGMDVSLGEFINLDVVVTGTMEKPKYKVMPSGRGGESSIKNQGKAVVKEKIAEAKEKVKEEIDKVKEKVLNEADRLKMETEEKAQAEVERLKKEAQEKVKAETDKVKEKAKDDVKDKARDLFKKKGLGF